MDFFRDVFGERGAMIFFIACAGVVFLILLLIICKALSKKRRKTRLKRDIQHVNALVENALPDVDVKDLTIVFANKTGSTANSRGKRSYTYEYFIYAFKEWESYAIPIKFRGDRAIAGEPVRLALDNVSRIVVRYMKTNAIFYDNNGNEIIEFTVAALNTKQIADECPYDIDQVEAAQKYFTFIERFDTKVRHKNDNNTNSEAKKSNENIGNGSNIDEVLSNEPLYDDHTEEALLKQ